MNCPPSAPWPIRGRGMMADLVTPGDVSMKPVLRDGVLVVELTVRERETLTKAHEIAVLLDSLHQETGRPLMDAIAAVLGNTAQ